MFRLIGAAALALAASGPVLAQGKGNDGNPGQGHDKDRGGNSEAAKGKDKGNSGAQRADSGRGNEAPARAVADRTRDEARDGRDDDRRRQTVERADFRDSRDDRRDDDWRWDDDRRDGTRNADRDRFYAAVPGCPPGLAKKNNGCLPPGIAKQARDETFGFAYRPALFGVPLRAGADYVYYDGYLIPSGSGGGGYVPLLGGALAIGQLWPEAYPSMALSDWQQDYYGFDDPDAYRYADNVVYEVDPATSAIEAVVALLSGGDFAVGEPMPDGFDVYNVPAGYQDRYADSDEAMYRYADGRVYEVDPVTMLIEKAIDLIV